MMKKMLQKVFSQLGKRSEQLREREIMLSAQMLSGKNRARERIGSLSEVEFSAFSQWGEDGILDWLISKIPNISESFVEFGAGDYREANTRYLLKARNWRGLLIERSRDALERIRRQEICWKYDITLRCEHIDRENINGLISGSGFSGEVGLLSIDIDGNDYWVWEAIEGIKPALVVCEYNAVFGDLKRLSVPYRADFDRTKMHFSNLYFGASLPALQHLASAKGYEFLGTNSNGVNAFFVRSDLAAAVTGSIDEIRSFPSVYRESRSADGSLTFVPGLQRAEQIGRLEVWDFEQEKTVPLNSIDPLYSDGWIKKMTAGNENRN